MFEVFGVVGVCDVSFTGVSLMLKNNLMKFPKSNIFCNTVQVSIAAGDFIP